MPSKTNASHLATESSSSMMISTMLFGCPAATFFQFSMAYLTIGINMDKIKDSIMTTERFCLRWVWASSGQCEHPKVVSEPMKVIDMVEAQGS